MAEAAAKLTFDTLEAERQLKALEQRLDELQRRSEDLHVSLPGGPSGGASSGNPSGAAPAVVGSSDVFGGLNENLSRLVETLRRRDERDASSAERTAASKSLWSRDQINEYAKDNKSDGPNPGRSAAGAITGALTSMAGASNPIQGFAAAGASIAGAIGGPIAGAVAGAISSLVGMLTAGAQEAVSMAISSSKLLRSEHMRTGVAGSSATVARRLSQVGAFGGWSNEEAAQMLAAEQSASGLASSVGGEVGLLKMAGVSEQTFGTYRGAMAQYGGERGTVYGGMRLAGMARNTGLDPNTILNAMAQQRSALAPFGSAGDEMTGVKGRDFMERVYSTSAGQATGRGAAEVITGVTAGNISRRQRFLDPVKSFASTIDDMSAYEKAAGSGAQGMFEFSAALADAATGQSAEDKALSYKRLGLSTSEAGIMLAASTGQSFEAGKAVAGAAGDYSIPTLDFGAMTGTDSASLSASYLEILTAQMKQGNMDLATATAHLSEIKGMIALQGGWDRGKRNLGIRTIGGIAAGLTGE